MFDLLLIEVKEIFDYSLNDDRNDQILVKPHPIFMHSRLEAIKKREKQRSMFVQHWLHRITFDRLSIYLTICRVRERVLHACACQLVRRSVNSIEHLSLSIYISHTVKPICAGMDAHKIRDQVPTCVCLFRSFAHDIYMGQLPGGNLSKVESLSLYKLIR